MYVLYYILYGNTLFFVFNNPVLSLVCLSLGSITLVRKTLTLYRIHCIHYMKDFVYPVLRTEYFMSMSILFYHFCTVLRTILCICTYNTSGMRGGYGSPTFRFHLPPRMWLRRRAKAGVFWVILGSHLMDCPPDHIDRVQ